MDLFSNVLIAESKAKALSPTMHRFLCLFVLVMSLGCASADHDMLMRQLGELQQARQNGTITETEYLSLKIQAEQAYGQRRASRRQRIESY